jgi:hypothetical protein|tara:strand:+ start:1431 stop:3005 length:1575 start_codon:yes stop_codon:yes gene_type:complete
MSKTYFVNKYDDMFIELFSKKTDWKKIENIKDISGEIDFCYNVDNNDIESKLKLISKENFTKYNSIEVKKTDITYDKIVNIYILLISEKDVYIYKEGKVNADKVRYYSEQSYFNYTFEQIKYDVFNKINPFLEENKLPSNDFNIIGMKYGIDEDYKVNLLEVDTDVDLSIEIDKLHKMKLHYWLFFDILNKFVFKNNLHHRWEKCKKDIKILNNNTNLLEIIVSSNKNDKIFDQAKQLSLNNLNDLSINGIFGIEYNDFNPNMKIINGWKEQYENIKLYIISSLAKTVSLDDKITFCKRMSKSKYLPECFYSYNEIPISTNNDEVFFVKSRGSTNAAGVNVYLYKDLLNINMENSVIQKSMKNPDLYQNKRYKIRIHTVIFNNNLYCYNKYFGNVSKIEYNNSNLNSQSEQFKKMHIMYQDVAPHYILNSEISENNVILDNIILALKDVKKNFLKEINLFNKNEFVLLGVDVVVNSNKNIQIIEINHRSNYQHGQYITSNIDIPSIRDLIILLITGNNNNYLLI